MRKISKKFYYIFGQDQFFILPRKSFRDPSADPSAKPFRGPFRKTLPRTLPQNPSARSFRKICLPSGITFRGPFRKNLPRTLPQNLPRTLPQNPSAEPFAIKKIDLDQKKKILPRSLPQNPSARSFRKICLPSGITFRGAFREILPQNHRDPTSI